jgi:hypothetical protein
MTTRLGQSWFEARPRRTTIHKYTNNFRNGDSNVTSFGFPAGQAGP